MFSKNWLVIKDDKKKTFEVYGKETNTNAFTNRVYGMQRVGMNVSCITPPVTNHASSKDQVKVQNYTLEDGLFERLQAEYQKIIRNDFEEEV